VLRGLHVVDEPEDDAAIKGAPVSGDVSVDVDIERNPPPGTFPRPSATKGDDPRAKSIALEALDAIPQFGTSAAT
jgi:hypothetical protein